MRKMILAAVCACLAGLTSFGPTARAAELTVLREISFPEKLRVGLDVAWDGQYLNVPGIVGIGDGTFGAGFLQIDPADGSLASEFGVGGLPARSAITFDGADYWATTATRYVSWSGVEVYAHGVEKWSRSDGTRLERFGFSLSWIEPEGLAWDGADLWLGDNLNGLISRLDPGDLSVVESFAAPGSGVRGLTWDGTAFWSLDGAEDRVYRFDSVGNVLASYSTPLGDLEGIAYHREYLWAVDNGAKKIVQFAVPEPSVSVLVVVGAACVLMFHVRHRCRGG